MEIINDKFEEIEIIFLYILVHQNPYFQKFPSDNYLTRDTKRKKKIPV